MKRFSFIRFTAVAYSFRSNPYSTLRPSHDPGYCHLYLRLLSFPNDGLRHFSSKTQRVIYSVIHVLTTSIILHTKPLQINRFLVQYSIISAVGQVPPPPSLSSLFSSSTTFFHNPLYKNGCNQPTIIRAVVNSLAGM